MRDYGVTVNDGVLVLVEEGVIVGVGVRVDVSVTVGVAVTDAVGVAVGGFKYRSASVSHSAGTTPSGRSNNA